MLLYNSDGQDPAAIAALLGGARASQPGLARPAAARRRRRRRSTACSACSASCRPGSRPCGAAGAEMRALLADDFRADFGGARRAITRLLNDLDVRGQLTGREPVQPVAVPLVQDRAAQLHPDMLGDRMEMAHSVEGRVPFLDHHVVEVVCAHAGVAEDPRDDGEVRAARGGARRCSPTRSTAGRSTRS